MRQARALSNKMLAGILNKEGYYQAKHTKGLWLHKTKSISFTLVVDAFGVCYKDQKDCKELIKLLEGTYPCKCDWSGSRYIGVNLDKN